MQPQVSILTLHWISPILNVHLINLESIRFIGSPFLLLRVPILRKLSPPSHLGLGNSGIFFFCSSPGQSEVENPQMVGRHENIVNLLGVCSQPLGQPLLVVLEFAQLGNLREFVQVFSCFLLDKSVDMFVQKRRLPGELCLKQMLVNITQVL